MSEFKGVRYVEVDGEQAGTPEYVAWLEKKVNMLEALHIVGSYRYWQGYRLAFEAAEEYGLEIE